MASVRDIKKEASYIVGSIIDSALLIKQTDQNISPKLVDEVIDVAVSIYDDVVMQINSITSDDKPKHYFSNVRKEFMQRVKELHDKLFKES